LQVPAHHPDRTKYYSLGLRQDDFNSSDPRKITVMNPRDILVLYTDGVYDGSDEEGLEQLEAILQQHQGQSAKDICSALLDYAVWQDDHRRQACDEDLIDDKTVFVVRRT
jgi:serine phosphatase RsbU (regulator of sigma subunit)